MDLPLSGTSNSIPMANGKGVKKKLWSTFDDMMSPIEPEEILTSLLPCDSGISDSSKLHSSRRLVEITFI